MKRGAANPDPAWSCAVDDTPGIWASIVPWLATATQLAGIDPSCLHVHHVCPLRPDIEHLCRALAVNTHEVAPLDLAHPHMNKIQQCGTSFARVERVVLTDVDIVFTGPLPLREVRTALADKPADRPNPPIEVLREVFAASGVTPLGTCWNAYPDRGRKLSRFETALGSFNGGMYVIAREQLGRVAAGWTHWGRWLVANIDLLGPWWNHADQVSFCLAACDLRATVGLLNDTWNFPTHLEVAPSELEPHVFHHHARLDSGLRLKPISAPQTQAALARVNDAIDSFRRRHFG